eukprot:2340999-Pyramimonas_sp.AAC.1
MGQVLPERGKQLVDECLRYKRHVCREEYENLTAWNNRKTETEEYWPEYKKYAGLVSRRKYLVDANITSEEWLTLYLEAHVQDAQEKKQHHVRIMNSKGERAPLTHCRRADDPKTCKAGFPRPLFAESLVMCKGVMDKNNLRAGGRRNELGALYGPRNEENVNGTHPALSAFLPTNTDVRLPCRFPVTEMTHNDSICDAKCYLYDVNQLGKIIEAMQNAQDAQ